ncbi:MAG TPA: efflux RND transporter periplasmic adaptor subunit [Steroidobacter sp.]
MYKTIVVLAALMLTACGGPSRDIPANLAGGHEQAAEQPPKGPNGGRLMTDGPFAIELAIFESGVPPEYHAWPMLDGKPLRLDTVELQVEVHRLGNKMNRFSFAPHGNYLRGDGKVVEPHSFTVNVTAKHQGQTHQWSFDSFEGRTTISREIADAAGVKVETAGPAILVETISLYGRVAAANSHRREIGARFPGVIRTVRKQQGDTVKVGEALAVVESNESLQTYTITSPIAGVVTERNANEGEQTADRPLFTIVDATVVWAELGVFQRDRARVRPGATVLVKAADMDVALEGRVDRVDVQAGANQMVTARVTLNNPRGDLLVGSFVTADVAVARHEAPLAVKRSGLQPFRDFTVVFERVGDTYEVRMLELGREHGEWVEVLGGLQPGAEYVAENSYLVKADVEKSGASHDH